MKNKLKAIETILQGTIRQTCEYMLVLLVILECNSVYRCVSGRPDSVYYLEVSAIVFGTILLAVLLWEDKKRLKCIFESCILLCGVLLFEILFLFFNAIKTDAVANYMLVFLMFLPLMILIFKVYHEMDESCRLLYVLSDIVFILAASSLVIWIMAVLREKLQPVGEILINWGRTRKVGNYLNLSFFWQWEIVPFIGKGILRNTGIFPEAPMYNIFLNAALCTELFLRKHIKWLRCILLSVVIFTTIGMIGVLLCIFSWFLKLFLRLKSTKFKMAGYMFWVLTAVLGAVFIRQKWRVGNGSFITHIDDYIAPIKAWTLHPIIGCGYENEAFIQGFLSDFRLFNPGLSNSITVVLAEGGIALFAFYFLPFVILFLRGIKTSERKIAGWALGIFGIFCTIIFHYRFFMVFLLAFGYSCACICFSEKEGLSLKFINIESKLTANRYDDFLLYILTAVLSVFIVIMSFSENITAFVINLFEKYRLGLENSQWRAIFLAMVLFFCISVAKSTIKIIQDQIHRI